MWSTIPLTAVYIGALESIVAEAQSRTQSQAGQQFSGSSKLYSLCIAE